MGRGQGTPMRVPGKVIQSLSEDLSRVWEMPEEFWM